MSENSRQTKITDFPWEEASDDRPEDIKRKRKSEEMSDDKFPVSKSVRGTLNQSTKSMSRRVSKSQEEDPIDVSDDETTETDDTKDLRKLESDEDESDTNDKKSPAVETAGFSNYFEKADDEHDEDDKEPHEDKAATGSKNLEGDEKTSSPSDPYFSPDSHEAIMYTDTEAYDVDEENYKEETEGDIYETNSSAQTAAGTPVEDLHRVSSSNLPLLGQLKSSKTHSVLFGKDGTEKRFTWNDSYVKMPCDKKNEMVIFKGRDKDTTERWSFIKRTYGPKIRDVFQLEDAILKYNGHRRQMWDFQCLKYYFLESRFAEENSTFFDKVLPKIVGCALDLDVLFKESIPLLRKDENHMITMTQYQAACLLANAFLCTFPWRNKDKRQSISLPTINFNSLFNGPTTDNRLEKIKCIIHYFERVTENMPDGNITFKKQVLSDSDFPDWEDTSDRLTQLHVSSEGTIEDDGFGMLQVDFANKYVGGGVIGHGCVQEEIRFMICPEMIVSRLVTEVLEDNEVLIMTGCERFSDYSGYGDTFKWTGNHEDKIERDRWDRKYTEVVAMDATHFGRDKHVQFSSHKVDRELNKAYCAFKCLDKYQKKIPAVCTGNWGCGAFGGNKELKALIQLIAASHAGRDVLFFTFHDKELVSTLSDVHSRLKENFFHTGDMVRMLRDFNKKKKFQNSSLFADLKRNNLG